MKIPREDKITDLTDYTVEDDDDDGMFVVQQNLVLFSGAYTLT